MMQAAARQWRDHGRPGSIVNIVAVIWRGLPGIAHSCAARAGVIYLSKTLAIEWAPLGIRVNCVAPGAIATGGLETYSDEARRELPRSNLMQRFGEPADVANAVIYLGAGTGGFITGETLVVDGGNQVWGDQWTIPRPAYFSAPVDVRFLTGVSAFRAWQRQPEIGLFSLGVPSGQSRPFAAVLRMQASRPVSGIQLRAKEEYAASVAGSSSWGVASQEVLHGKGDWR